MRTVEENGANRCLPQQLEPPRPACRREATAYRPVVQTEGNAIALRVLDQGVEQPQGDGGIGGLVAPQQPDAQSRQRTAGPRRVDDDPVPASLPEGGVIRLSRPGSTQRSLDLLAASKDRAKASSLGTGDGQVAPLDDRRLLGTDGSQGRSQQALVVVLDVGDHRHPAIQDIGRVQPAAQAHLHQREVDPRTCKLAEGGGGQRLEFSRRSKARSDSLDGRRDCAQDRREAFPVDRPSVDGDPLAIADQVGLWHGADAQPRLLQRGSCQGHDAALAVGAAYEGSAQPSLGMAEHVEERLDPLQAQADAKAAPAAQGGHRRLVVRVCGRGQAPSSS